MPNQPFPNANNTILEPVAVASTTYWRQYMSGTGLPAQDQKRAFNISMSDIQNLAMFQNLGCSSVRAYVVLDAPNDLSNMRIILVPVQDPVEKQPGRDLLQILNPNTGQMQSTIYDLTTPCPQICDDQSPLSV